MAQALLECLMFLELSDDEAVNPDDAVRVMETVQYIFGRLPAMDRPSSVGWPSSKAALQSSEARRAFLLSLPEGFGLIDTN